MSILDENYSDCTENIVEAALSRPKNPLHIDISDEDYEKVREIYYLIRNLYQTFFRKHCFYNTLEEINKSVTSELTRVILGFSHPEGIWSSPDTLKATRTFVDHALYPASYDDMLAFLKEVHSGSLEFMCQYPDEDGVKSIDRVKTIEVLLL